jgi:sugar phosphate isomerase/epimerase
VKNCSFKTGLIISGPDVPHGPLALLSGSLAEKVGKAARLGFDGVELMVRDPAKLDWVSIKDTVGNAGLEIPQVVTGELFGADGLCLATADQALARRAMERLRGVMDMAAYLGAMVNIGRLRGRLSSLASEPDPWAFACRQLGSAVAYAAEKGVKITLEPINRYETDFVLNASEGMQLIEDIGAENLGLMLDMFHMNIEEPSIEEGFRLAGERLWHVHLADSNRHYPGRGHLNYSSIFATLADIGFRGYVSAEILPLPDPDSAAIRTMEFLRTQGIVPTCNP